MDWTLKFGDIITVVVFAISAVGGIAVVRQQVGELTKRMTSVETEMKKMVEVLVGQARQEERMNALDQRLLLSDRQTDDLKRQVDRLFTPNGHVRHT